MNGVHKIHADFYGDFSRAVMDADPLARPAGLDPAYGDRFAIYRNNVQRGLSDALAAAYPMVVQLVGTEFFRIMAGEFIRSEPRRGRSLALYGAGFDRFVASHDRVSHLPYLADIARLERARLEALHAADAQPLFAADLAGQESRLGELTFGAHPACRLVVSEYPIHAIWQYQNGQRAKSGPIVARPETVLITRPNMDLMMTGFYGAGACFVTKLLRDGACVNAAYEAACRIHSDFDVTQHFADLITRGAFAAVQNEEHENERD